MTLEEFRDWLARVERTFPVLDWRVDGLQVWPMIRLMTHGASFHGRSEGNFVGAGGAAYARMLAKAGTTWLQASIVDRAHSDRPTAPADAVFLAYSAGRQPLIDGRRFNPLLAPYVELLRRRGLKSRVWEMAPQSEYNLPRFTPSTFVQPSIIGRRIASLLRRRPSYDVALGDFDALIEDADRTGVDFPYRSRERLNRDVYFIRLMTAFFRRRLSRVQPRIVFMADASLREQALCVACRELGITSVEIQHGVQERNPTYAEWHAVPADGFATRPRAFWSWDPVSTNAIASWAGAAPSAHTALMGGDPWMDMWLTGDQPLTATVRAGLLARRAARGGQHHILVTLSSIGPAIPDVLVAAIRAAPPEYRWWFRMHPINQARRREETRAIIESLGCDADLMEYATQAPLFALLPLVDAHVSAGFSTVIQQAAAAGVPSVGFMAAAADLFAAEAQQGMLRVGETPDDIVRMLRESIDQPRRLPVAVGSRGDEALTQLLALKPAGVSAV